MVKVFGTGKSSASNQSYQPSFTSDSTITSTQSSAEAAISTSTQSNESSSPNSSNSNDSSSTESIQGAAGAIIQEDEESKTPHDDKRRSVDPQSSFFHTAAPIIPQTHQPPLQSNERKVTQSRTRIVYHPESFLLKNLRHPIEKETFSNGRFLEILEAELELKMADLSLDSQAEIVRNFHEIPETSLVFYFSNMPAIILFFLGVIPFEFDFDDDYSFKIYSSYFIVFFTTATCFFLYKNAYSQCRTRIKHNRIQQDFTNKTERKIRVLIEKLKKRDPTVSISTPLLSSYISDIDFSQIGGQAMLREINMSQILQLRENIGIERFDTFLRSLLPKDTLFIMEFLIGLDPSCSIVDQIKRVNPGFLALLKKYIIENDKTIWVEIMKRCHQDFDEDTKMFKLLANELLDNPNDLNRLMANFRLRISE